MKNLPRSNQSGPTIGFSKKFIKSLSRLPAKDQQRFKGRLGLFVADHNHPALRLHPLKGKYSSHYSINITGDLRAIFKYQPDGSILFSFIGTHSQLY